ncbi:MAG: class D beta-lactamase [Chitinophagaceae bacterium]
MRIAIIVFLLVVIAGCTNNNVKTDNSLASFFKERNVNGTFAILNNGTGQFTIYNLKRYRDSFYLPGSSFDIVTALVGLQTGKIFNEKMVVNWDGVSREDSNWNKDLTMVDAFKSSAPFYFPQIARQIGKDSMEFWLNQLKYGAATDTQKVKIKTTVDSFWIDNSLKILPDQQLGFIKNLYCSQLPGIYRPYQEMVKAIMSQEERSTYKLSYKTGWGQNEKGEQIGWVCGWIEENNHPYFFVINFTADISVNVKATGVDLLKAILKQQGFFEGRM